LYQQGVKKTEIQPTTLDKEVKKFCTFNPNRVAANYKPVQSSAGPKGFKETIDRMRKAQEEKEP
jgi:hypothetical protein